MQKVLKGGGYKLTKARKAVLDILIKAKTPLTVEDISKALKKSSHDKGINNVTVYRALSLFEKKGVVKRVDLRKDSAYFEIADCHHHHIACMKCETIEDFESKEIERALERVVRNSSKFFDIKDHSLELFGICKKCL